jgi:NAD(P)H-hydrate epimerase
MKRFTASELRRLYRPDENSSGEDNGQVAIIGGSDLFHGAPILSLKAASKIVDMVFFASPYEPAQDIAAYLKSELSSFIWVPWGEVDKYIDKSDAVLVGPGFKRYAKEGKIESDESYKETREITKELLKKHKSKKWVIDAGSLQTMDADWIPETAILTPNKKEYRMLFGSLDPKTVAEKHNCIIVLKGPVSYVYSSEESIEIHGGNAGMTKGGTGDVMAGLTVALLAKNEPFFAACSAAYIVKAAGDELHKKQGVYFSADDLAEEISKTLFRLLSSRA